MISSRGNRVMNGPSTRSSVTATAMARTRGPLSLKNLSRSFASGKLDDVERAGEPVHDDALGRTDQENVGFFGGHDSLQNCASALPARRPTFTPASSPVCSTSLRKGSDQLGAERAVDHAVIAGVASTDSTLANAMPPSFPFPSACRRAAPTAKNCRLRRIDDGGKFAHAEHAEVGDRGTSRLRSR